MQTQQAEIDKASEKVTQACIEAMRRMQKLALESARKRGLSDCDFASVLVNSAISFACEVAIEHEKAHHEYGDENAVNLCVSLAQCLGATFQEIHGDLMVPKSQYDS